jgi:hypothetical protein
MYGYNHPATRTGTFSDSDTDNERFHPLKLNGDKNLTKEKMDAYYVCLGQLAVELETKT